jgi:hypothetical protein
MNLDQRFLDFKLNAYLPEEDETVPMPKTEVLTPIVQTPLEKILETTGITLEEVGNALDSIGKINIKGVEIGLRDLLPFVGSTENGQTIGTPAALQSAARGERLIKGGSLQTATLTPDTQSMVADVATAGLAGPAFKGVKNIIKVLK